MKQKDFCNRYRVLLNVTVQQKFYLLVGLPLVMMILQCAFLIESSDNLSFADISIWLPLVIMGAVSVFITLFLGSFFYHGTMLLRQGVQKIMQGDLTHRMGFPNKTDEFCQLANDLDEMSGRRQHTFKLIGETADGLHLFAEEFFDAAQEGQNLAKNQRQHIDSLATAMEEMSAAVREVAKNASDTSSNIQLTSEEANKGAQRVQNTIDSIQLLTNEIQQASAAVTHLTERTNKISDVITVINGISGQTNLLALNAAIEAARAGEQGRGFAVVADEVRTLAGRTQQATVEIQHMIDELQEGTGTLNSIMDKTVTQATNSQELIVQVGQDIDRISQHSETIFEMSAQIATSAEEQSSVSGEIASRLDTVRDQSGEIEESTGNTAAGTENLLVTARELTQMMKGMTLE